MSPALPAQEHPWFLAEANKAKSLLEAMAPSAARFVVKHFPVGASTEWTPAELVAAAEHSVLRKTGWPIGIFSHNPEFSPKPTKFGARAIIEARNFGSFDFWSIDKDGRYLFVRWLDEDSDRNQNSKVDRKWIYFDTRIWRVAETLLHCSKLYRELGLQPEVQIAITISHEGIRDRLLGVGSPKRMMHWNRKCEEDESSWNRVVPLGSIEPNLQELTKEITEQLFALFEFWRPEENIFREIFAEFVNSRV